MTRSSRASAVRKAAVGIGLGAAAAAIAGKAVAHYRSNGAITDNVAPDLRPFFRLLPLTAFERLTDSHPARGAAVDLAYRLLPRGLAEAVTIPGRDGAPDIPAFCYDPPGRARPSGAVVWIHGGGMILGAPPMDHAICNAIARDLGVLVLSVDYRLAPEHPFPSGPEDCFTALAWLHDHALELGVDRSRIAVGGESAGGGLAATLAQMACDRGLPVAFQGLVYPMLDDRTVLADRPAEQGRLIWTRKSNENAWAWYLGHPVTEGEDRPYASAARRDDLSGLPPAWIGVGSIDLFHDEDVAYADRLIDAGVPVELVIEEGMPHAADAFQLVPRMKAFRTSMIEAMGAVIA